jgi:predicted GIY-YIG superfamily endonuclease
MWYVYIIRSINFPEQEYVGATEDLKRRLPEHNAGKSAHTRQIQAVGINLVLRVPR